MSIIYRGEEEEDEKEVDICTIRKYSLRVEYINKYIRSLYL